MRHILRHSSWCDVSVLPDGRAVFVALSGQTVEAFVIQPEGLLPIWRRSVAQSLLFLRAAADRAGNLLAIGQGHDDGHVRIVIQGRDPIDLGPSHGVFCVEACATDGPHGWDVYIVRPGGVYEVIAVSPTGLHAPYRTVETPTSQGFLQCDGGVVRLQDTSRFDFPGMVLAEIAGGLALGQNADNREERLLLTDGPRIARAYQGFGHPPHLVRYADGYAACAWTEDGAWVETWAEADIPWGNDIPAQGDEPVPSPRPSVPRPPKDEPMTIEKREAIARAGYPAPSDIVEGALSRFRHEVLLERDKVGAEGMTLPALRYFVQHYCAAMAKQQVEFGVPGSAEGWGHYSAQAFIAAAQAYERDQKGGPVNPQ